MLIAALAAMGSGPSTMPAAGAERTVHGAVQPAKGWRLRVYADDIANVDNVVVAADGQVYVTQELSSGNGRIVRVRASGPEVVLGGLHRPDGLLARGRYLYVTEEVPDGRVLRLEVASGSVQELARLNKPEGIEMLADGELIVAEDSVNGRVVRIRRNGAVETMMGGLNRPEGIAVAKDGTIYVAETATGRVLAYRNADVDTVANDLDEPDQIELAPDGALWITEDAEPGRLLRHRNGALQTIVSGLHAPQGIAFLPNGTVLVAEQGRNRILAVQETPGADTP